MSTETVSSLGHIRRLLALLLVAGMCLALCGPGLGSRPVEARDISWVFSSGDAEIPVARTYKPSLWVERAYEVDIAGLDPTSFTTTVASFVPRPDTVHHWPRSSWASDPRLARGPPAFCV